MKTRLLYLLPLAVLLWGCPSSDSETPEPEETCYLQTYTKFQPLGGNKKVAFSTKYTYNTQGQLTTVALDSANVTLRTGQVSYDSQKRLSEIAYPNSKVVYTYNAQNQLTRQSRHIASGNGAYTENEYYTFAYGSKGHLSEARYHFAGTDQSSWYYTWKYTYNDSGNPTRIEMLDARGDRLSLTEISFDNHPSPQNSLPPGFFEPLLAASAHNPVAVTVTNQHQGTLSFAVSYTYNPEGLPVSAVKTYGSGEQEQMAYTYTCF
ncbi:hypothetical protein [Pontibacter oryzae]|nr:hypothetical protein [Pontibacter oryzae]